MMRYFWLFFAGIVSISGVAMATPERLTTSEDRLIAATQTHLYVMRHITDNQGSHYSALHDQHLIEISMDTYEAARFWPLRRMTINHLETNDFLVPGQVTEREGETHDMTGVLRGQGAEPMLPQVWAVDGVSLVDGALMRGEETLVTPFGIRAAARAQLAILREAYPPIETEEEYRRAERIDFYDLYQEGDWECVLRPEGVSLFRTTGRLVAVKLHCEDADLTGAWSFHILVPDES